MKTTLNVSLEPKCVWIEKVAGRGEDSDGLIRRIGDCVLTLGVFDGLGGSGGRLLKGPNGFEKSAARVASDLARLVTDEVMADFFHDDLQQPIVATCSIEALPKLLESRLHERFEMRAIELDSDRSRIRGSLSRRLPTTLCVLVARPGDNVAAVEVHCLWAGDSRAYLWTPSTGLCQLTRDHTRQPFDAFDSLRVDAPMSNFVTPDLVFYIEHHRISISGPLIVFCASDGCFHHFASPMEFEVAILSALGDTLSWSDAVKRLAAEIGGDAKDDVSLAIAGFNWPDDRSRLDAVLQRRSQLLNERNSIQKAGNEERVSGQGEDWRSIWWQDYRKSYESLLPESAFDLENSL